MTESTSADRSDREGSLHVYKEEVIFRLLCHLVRTVFNFPLKI